VQARFHGTLRGRTGLRDASVDLPADATVRQALNALAGQAPTLAGLLLDEHGDMQPAIMVFRNGRNIDLIAGADTPLQADHTLDIFPRSHAQRAFATD